jgi:hypothetical protein
MIISEKDIDDTTRVGEIIKKINNISDDYARSESDVIFQQQPFLISLVLGHQNDLSAGEIEELTKLLFIIWEYFKHNGNIRRVKVTELQFEKIQLRNMYLLKYLEGEPGQKEKTEVITSDLEHLNSKALLTGIFLRFNTQEALIKMKTETKGILLIGMKSLVECFEEIEKSN